jgi:hypothetical protein
MFRGGLNVFVGMYLQAESSCKDTYQFNPRGFSNEIYEGFFKFNMFLRIVVPL